MNVLFPFKSRRAEHPVYIVTDVNAFLASLKEKCINIMTPLAGCEKADDRSEYILSKTSIVQCDALYWWNGREYEHIFTDTSDALYLLVYFAPNSHHQPKLVRNTRNLSLVKSAYHSRTAYYLIRVEDDMQWTFDVNCPRPHSHGTDLYRVEGKRDVFYTTDDQRESERNIHNSAWSSTERALYRASRR